LTKGELAVWLRMIYASILARTGSNAEPKTISLGIAERMVKRMPNAQFILIPISDATRGHGTHTVANVWKGYLAEFMQKTEPRP
jgi:hypothetical protein